MMSPDQFVLDYQPRWEGKMSRDPNDAGNWSTGVKGKGTLIGSNHGITGRVLAAYRGVSVVTVKDMENLTAGEAKDIALKLFYKDVGLKNLVWNPVTASVMDFGYNAGPGRSIRLLQDMLDVNIDGAIGVGGSTATAFEKFCRVKGFEFAAGAWWALREEYYEDLVVNKPSNGMYLKGWDNRSDYFTPGHTEGWWKRFMGA